MTNERIDDQNPRTDDDRERADRARERESANIRPQKQEEPNPLLREGPDAPDAADIEEPEKQL